MRLSLALTGLLLAGNAWSAETGLPDAAARTHLDATLADWMARTRVPGVAIARIDDGKLAWTRTWGQRAPGVPVDADTVFNVASLTKPAFATMVLRHVAAGELDLDASLTTYWVDPDIARDPRRNALTPRIALSHQTGLQNWRGGKPLAFAFAPGERHEYSGEGYEYLRRAIERESGRPMPDLMREYVLEPAGMGATRFGWDERIEGHLATGFGADGTPYDMDYLRERGPNAAANMFTTIGDYGRFTAWVANDADLPAEVFQDMQRPQALHPDPAEQFGLGWRVTMVNQAPVLSHDGREKGVRTQVFVFPDSGDGLVILTNGDNGELLTRPVVEATLPAGPALLDAIDHEIWHYLQRMPSGQVGQLAQMLPRSPPFMAKLLYAADATLVTSSPLAAVDRRRAHDAIAPFIQGLVEGHIEAARATALVEMLLESPSPEVSVEGEALPRWRTHLDQEQAKAWMQALTKPAD